ncbi:MAG: hypothetical protein Q9227_001441 [Pyrenula ochraceoflavens]
MSLFAGTLCLRQHPSSPNRPVAAALSKLCHRSSSRRSFSVVQHNKTRPTAAVDAALLQQSRRCCYELGYKRWKIRSYVEDLARSRRRWFSSTPAGLHGHLEPPKPGEEWVSFAFFVLGRNLELTRPCCLCRLHVTFIDKEGEKHEFEVAKGDNLLDIAQANDLEMEGACGGSCACSTCHVILEDPEMYDKLPEPDDDENDMLDLAFGLTETSRLGCQVKMAPEIDGLVVRLPSMTRNLQASDFEKKK